MGSSGVAGPNRSGRNPWLARRVLLGLLALLCAEVHAASYRIDARTEASFYEMRSYRGAGPSNPEILPRRRLVQSLALSAFELVRDQDLGFDASLRLHADLGLSTREAELLDGRRVSEVQVQHAALSWRDLGGRVDLKLGRQVDVDELDFLAFDGLKAVVKTPLRVKLEAYGGLLVKGTSPLGSPTLSPDGVRDSDARRLRLTTVPDADRELGATEPLFGVRATTDGFWFGTARAGYRRSVLLPLGGEGVDPFGRGRVRVDMERLGGALNLKPILGARLYGGFDFDLLQGRLAQGRAGGRYDQPAFAVSVEALRLAPVFSADSIWAYFATGARDEVRGRVDAHVPGLPVHAFASAVAQRYAGNLQDEYVKALSSSAEPIQTNLAHGLSAGVSLPVSVGRGLLDVMWRNGYGGRQLWANVSGGVTFEALNLSIDGRFSLASIRDSFNPNLHGTSTGVQLLAGYRLVEGAKLTAMLENNLGTFTRNDTRLYGLLDLGANL